MPIFTRRPRKATKLRKPRPLKHRKLSFETCESRIVLAEASGLFNDSVLMRTDRSSQPVPLTFSGYTVEAWIRRADANRCETVISSGYSVISNNQGYWFGVCNGGTVSFQSNTANSPMHSGNTFIPTNVWTHVAATWTPFEERLYVNGELDVVHAAGFEPNRGQNNLYVGAWRNEFFGGPSTSHFFLGYISEARVWQTLRTQDQIRQSMHQLIEGRPSGLLASWHMATDFAETTNNLPVTNSNPCICGPAAPPLWRVAEIDPNFNRLPAPRSFATSVSVPNTNTGYLIGGTDASGANRREIYAVDLSTGTVPVDGGNNMIPAATLPAAGSDQASAYVPTNNSIYIFGGGFNVSTIVRYDLTTNTVTELATTLPTGLFAATAVWHPGIQRVVIVGGISGLFQGGGTNSIVLFDPATGIATPAAVLLPAGRSWAAVSYSSLTKRLYVFGGLGGPYLGEAATNTTWELAINAEGSGVVTPLPQANLPLPHTDAIAFEDPESHLIHILGGSAEYAQVFDPRSGKTWRTMQRMPRDYANGNNNGSVLNGSGQSVVYNPRNRHSLVIGGSNFGQFGSVAPTNKVWRVPLGDGPAIPIERWEVINSIPTIGSRITDIDGDDRGVYFASQQDGGDQVVGISETGQSFLYNPPGFNGSVNDIAVNASGLWAGYSCFGCVSEGGAWNFYNGTATQYGPAQLGTSNVYSLQPDWPFIGTDQGLKSASAFGWNTTLHPNPNDFVWAQTGSNNNTWAIVRDAPPVQSSNSPWRLSNVSVNAAGGPTVREFPSSCGNDFLFPPGQPPIQPVNLTRYNDIVQDHSGNLWVVGWGAGAAAICYKQANTLASAPDGGVIPSLLSNRAEAVDVDADNRVWVALRSNNGTSGGLSVYEMQNAGARNADLRNSDYNWLNAPIGSRRLMSGGTEPVWNSTIVAVAGVDEKVYAAKEAVGSSPGGVVTVAQRWQQIDDVLAGQVVTGIWTVAGRTFFNVASGLYELKPDGLTFEFRGTLGNPTNVVAGDGAGRIWIGSNQGPRLYTPTGFDEMTDRLGTKPTGSVNAIVEETDIDSYDGKAAPVWIGGVDGLTLFDRDRFVTTFTAANSGLPATTVTSILVDTNGNVWAGTTAGLARLSADRTTWMTFTTAQGLPNNSIYDLAQLADGRIAVSTANGLSLFNGASFATQSPPVTAANLPLSVDDIGRLWAGSAVLTGMGWRGYWSTNSGLKYSTISDTATDGADRIWFSHSPNPGISVRGTFLPPLKDFTPIITDHNPKQGKVGTEVTITGASLGADPNEIVVTIGGSVVDELSVNPGEVRVRLGNTARSGLVSLNRGGKVTSDDVLFCATPDITSYTPTGGNVGTFVDVRGTNFDTDAKLRIGGQLLTNAQILSPTHIRAQITGFHETGLVTVENHCAGQTDTGPGTFHLLDIDISLIDLNQGIQAYGVIQDKPTIVSNFLTHHGNIRFGDVIEIDRVEETVLLPGGGQRTKVFDLASDFKPRVLSGDNPTSSELITLDNSLHVGPYYFQDAGPQTLRTKVFNNGILVAERDRTVEVAPNQKLRVVLVPIMQDNYVVEELYQMRDNIYAGLDDLRQRIYPFGTVELVWSDEVKTINSSVTLDNAFDLYNNAPHLDRARRHWNEKNPNRPAQIAFGVVDPRRVAGSIPGFAFWPDATDMLNKIALDKLDALCDFANDIINVIGLGSDDGCKLDIPLHVGWAIGGPRADFGGMQNAAQYRRQVSSLIGHEIGHALGLVKPYAANGALFDNLSHSVNDEINGTRTCNDRGDAPFDITKTFAWQPGVTIPIVNPLSNQEITFLGASGGPDLFSMRRPKAIMSYACGRENHNVFFEPADLAALNFDFLRYAPAFLQLVQGLGGNPSPAASPAVSPAATSPAAAPTPIDIPGQRLHISGMIDVATGETGDIARVENYGDEGPLSLPFDTGYWLVQLDPSGNELSRQGIYPISHNDNDPTQPANALGFFAATVVRAPNVFRIELRHNASVLDSFAASGNTPTASFISPSQGANYQSGNVTVQWTANDADLDVVDVTLEYSRDDGATWRTVHNAIGSGSTSIPVTRLGGAAGTGRFRIIASDGLNRQSVLSPSFSIANQAPVATIAGEGIDLTVFEGQPIHLSATAFDLQDGELSGGSLKWYDNFNGAPTDLGTGNEINVTLSAGLHTITMYASNSAGAVGGSTLYVNVRPDYDFDLIDDDAEAAATLNPLNGADVHTDADNDGLSYLAETRLLTNPNSIDSDGDGRSDTQELTDGSNPNQSDPPPAADSLRISPSNIAFNYSFASLTQHPSQGIQVLSDRPADWTVTTNVDWLEATASTGTTPQTFTLRVQANELPDGVHTANLTFTSVLLNSTVVVPVQVTSSNATSRFDLNNDGSIGLVDLWRLQSRLDQSNPTPTDGDLNLDHQINRDDVAYFLAQYGPHTASPSPAPAASPVVVTANRADEGVDTVATDRSNTLRLSARPRPPVDSAVDELFATDQGVIVDSSLRRLTARRKVRTVGSPRLDP